MKKQLQNDTFFRSTSIALVVTFLLFITLEIALPQWRVPIGIASRIILGIVCFFYSFWYFRIRRSVLGGGLLLLVGIGLVVTALLGYSINGTPPLPWLFKP